MTTQQPTILSPADIAALLSREGGGSNGADYDESTEPEGARQRRTELLADTLATCQHLWQSGAIELDLVAETLGTASRDGAWKLPFGDSKILDFFLGAMTVDGLRNKLQVHALRLIGNTCAYMDENRARVVQGNYVPAIMRCLHNDALVPYAIPVLYNIMLDYEPAQIAASEAGLSNELIALVTTRSFPNLPSEFLANFLSRILGLLVTHEVESAMAAPVTVDALMQLALGSFSTGNIPEFVSLASVAVAYLVKERFQTALVAGPNFGMFLAMFEQAQSVDAHSLEDPDTKTQLTQLRIALLNMLADLSALDSFTTYHPLTSPAAHILISWLSGPNVSAACLALGNVARSDEVSLALVQVQKAHLPLIKLLSDPTVTDSQILHGSMAFLKNLAIPVQNRAFLTELLSPTCLPRIYVMETLPQVHFAAASLTRLLLVNSPENVKQICAPLNQGSSPNADLVKTSLHGLLAMFQKSDAEPTRLEAARAVAALCRVLHSTPILPALLPGWDTVQDNKALPSPTSGPKSPDDGTDNQRREAFYQQHDLSQILAFLITQSKWPILRSEAWFVFALMCRSADGSGVMLKVLSDPQASTSVIEAVTGQQSVAVPTDEEAKSGMDMMGGDPNGPAVQLEPQQVDPTQKANITRVDRENVVVLCTELLNYRGAEIPPAQHALLQDLVTQGTHRIATERAQRQTSRQAPGVKQEPAP